jgi:CO dehydrogenase/acetyl-CoA synthase beta subunit
VEEEEEEEEKEEEEEQGRSKAREGCLDQIRYDQMWSGSIGSGSITLVLYSAEREIQWQ